MIDNFEPDKNVSPCENCVGKYNPERCKGCKHRNKKIRPMRYWGLINESIHKRSKSK